MIRNVKKIIGYTLGTIDGKIGEVKDFYFDDKTRTIRYLIVETGSLFFKRKVLISTQALVPSDWNKEILPVNLNIQQVENSPEIDIEKPVSRQQEMELNKHYSWKDYRTEDFNVGSINNDDQHLRSFEEVINYKVKANNGEVGKINDFLIDDTTWEINFIVVDALLTPPAKFVPVLSKLIKEIQWENATILIDSTVEKIKNSPQYFTDEPIDEAYVESVYNYYGIPLLQKQY
ncbi:MAG: PRC-barrel domain-containing protein [Bacteroidia bacterium]|nr:PRC-barrel domain-containing protein [Bacteroidia bacterium]